MTTRMMLIAVLSCLSMSASAHDAIGPHGGWLTDAGPYHIELVVHSGNVHLYVSDTDDKPISAAGFKALAILAAAGKPQRIVLQSIENARLSGPAPGDLATPPKGVVQLTAPDGKTAQAKFQ